MPTANDHSAMLRRRLPVGPIWDGAGLDALLAALSEAPADVDAAAEQFLADFMPDTAGGTGALIDDWARVLGLPEGFESDAWFSTYTDAQKAAIIVAKLRGRVDPNLPNMQSIYEALFDDPNVILRHRVQPPFLVGLRGASWPVGDAWQSVWTLEYMTNLLTAEPDDFELWQVGANVTVVNDAAQSPVTAAPTAAQIDLPDYVDSDDQIYIEVGVGDNTELHFAVYFRAQAADTEITFTFFDRNNDPHAETVRAVHAWARYILHVNSGSGVTIPYMTIRNESGSPQSYMLSFAVAGIRLPEFELRAQALAPINTVGVFDVIGALPQAFDDFDDAGLIDDADDSELTL